ncbi:MAG TPA: MauE/DoxX family redox-associated membrane protein [Planosporangium sp.]|nr:MauE/DoxX family redox-associated membrane protein [Planosporangium sp.]
MSIANRWPDLRPWLGTLARVALAAVWLIAGGSKVTDLAGSGRAVAAFRLMPVEMARIVGAALPFVEFALGVLLLLGLATRLAAAVSAALFAGYIVGIAAAWARGLSIDCGCFGGGGQLAPGQHPNYAPDILRDVGLLLVAGFLVVWPRTRLAIDEWLLVGETA